MPRLLCFGYGYVAAGLSRDLLSDAENWQIAGTHRSNVKADAGKVRLLKFNGVEATNALRDEIARADYVLHSIAPDADGDPVYRVFGEDLRRAAGTIKWFGYLSTTGVYGDRGGDWVDEGADCAPEASRSRQRLQAEGFWQSLCTDANLPVHVFRLAGIYGPGRSQLVNVQKGTARRLIKPGQVFSRIHLDDIVQVLEASIQRPNPGRIYNAADDEPAPPQDAITYAGDLLGMSLPPEIPFAQADLSPMAKSFYSENKRVANRRIKAELGVDLLYPTYREGLERSA